MSSRSLPKSFSYEDDSFYVKVSDVLVSLDGVLEDSAFLLFERSSDHYANVRLLNSDGKEVDACREIVEWEAYSDGFRTALEIVEKHFKWLEKEKELRDNTRIGVKRL